MEPRAHLLALGHHRLQLAKQRVCKEEGTLKIQSGLTSNPFFVASDQKRHSNSLLWLRWLPKRLMGAKKVLVSWIGLVEPSRLSLSKRVAGERDDWLYLGSVSSEFPATPRLRWMREGEEANHAQPDFGRICYSKPQHRVELLWSYL